MKLSLSQAAEYAKKNKGQISNALKSNKLSGEKLPDGSWSIDPSELTRWLDATRSRSNRQNRITTPENDIKTPPETLALATELAAVKAKLEASETERERERKTLSDTIEDLRARLDAESRERRELSARLLPAPEPAPLAPQNAPQSPGWFSRTFLGAKA